MKKNEAKKQAVIPPAPAKSPAPPVSRPGLSRTGRLLFWLILLFGAVVRLWWLGRASYMIDEINVVRDAATQATFTQVFNTELDRFGFLHRLPLLMLILHAMFKAFAPVGSFPPEWLARLPFALFGIGALPFFYLLGRALKNTVVGLWSMFLAAISVFFIFYSREAYDYAMLIFFTVGALWGGAEMIGRLVRDEPVGWPVTLGYIFFSAGLLQAHLSGLLFLAPWNALMVVVLIRQGGWKRFFKSDRILYVAATLGAAYLAFLPFLLRLMGGGFTSTENELMKRFTFEVFPGLLGRMGWGEWWLTVLLFAGFMGLGLVFGLRDPDRDARRTAILLGAQLLVYFAVQSYTLRVSRFEVRYYSPIFPLFIVLVAAGMEYAVGWVGVRRATLKPAMLRAALAAPLILGLLPSVGMTVRLDCRGYNYKGIARWIMDNVPTNGIAAFHNVYELRGVPSVYPTPGRFVTCVAAWSNEEDYQRNQVPRRFEEMFTRFPLIRFMEVIPTDVLAPQLVKEFIPRDRFFMRQEWLVDNAWRGLAALRTLPIGEVQWFSGSMDKVLLSYNLPEDLPALAAKQGRSFYVYFGPEWGYLKDQQMNDWMTTERGGTVIIGNIKGQPVKARLLFRLVAVPAGASFSVIGPDGARLVDNLKVPPEFRTVPVPGLTLAPGESTFRVQVLPLGAQRGQLWVYAVTAEPDAD